MDSGWVIRLMEPADLTDAFVSGMTECFPMSMPGDVLAVYRGMVAEDSTIKALVAVGVSGVLGSILVGPEPDARVGIGSAATFRPFRGRGVGTALAKAALAFAVAEHPGTAIVLMTKKPCFWQRLDPAFVVEGGCGTDHLMRLGGTHHG